MKNRWLLVLLAASLGLNLAAAVTFVYTRYRKRQWRDAVLRRLIAGTPGKIAPLIDEHRFKMDSLRMEYWEARGQLARLSLLDSSDPITADSVLDRIAEIHRAMNRLVYETSRRAVMLLPPPERERVRQCWCNPPEGLPPHPPVRPHPRGRMRPKWRDFK